MPSRLGHGLYKKIDRLKNIIRCNKGQKPMYQGVRYSESPLYETSAGLHLYFHIQHYTMACILLYKWVWLLGYYCDYVLT